MRRHVAIALSALFLLACLSLSAQTPSAPPMMVQVPYIGIGAGNIQSNVGSATKASGCTGYANAGGNNYGDGCPANQVGVSTPWGTAVDAWGNVYFSDEGHLEVRVIYAGATTVNGVANPATTMIGNANNSLSPGTLTAGNVYALAGGLAGATVTTCNGGGTALSVNGSGCPATDSYIKGPYSPAVDSAGNVFIPDKSNSLVYVVLANSTGLAAQLVTLENPSVTKPQVGYIYQIVSKGGGYVDGVIANSGEIHAPYSIAVDSSENLYIADFTNNAVRMVNGPSNTTSGGVGAGFIHTIAGSTCSSSGCTALSGTPASGVAAIGAAFVGPGSVVVDGSGNVYVGDNSNNATSTPTTVRVIYAGGANNPLANLINLETDVSSPVANDVYTIAGNKNSGSSGEGAGLLATNANVNFDRIEGLGLDSHGNLYIMDYGSHSELAEVNADTGILIYLSADGDASSAGKYTVGDYCSNDTATGSGPTALDEYGDGCPAPQSNADNAQGNIGIDPSGNLYFADNGDNLIRKLTFNNSFPGTNVGNTSATQNLAFLLETGSTGDTVSSVSPVIVSTQGNATSSEFTNAVTGDSCSGSTTLKGLTSSSSNTANTVCIVPIVFKPVKPGARSGAVQITGIINGATTLLGTVYLNGNGKGAELAIDPGTSSTLGSGSEPAGVATDSAGNVYVAYSGGTVYRTPNGGGAPVEIGSGLTTPHQVAIDGAGNLYVADSGTNEIVEFAGASTSTGAITGTTLVSGLSGPKGVAVDASGNLYVAETDKVLVQPIDAGMLTALGSGFDTPVALAVDAGGNVYVADTGLNGIEKLTITNGVVTQQSSLTLLSGAVPVSVAVDAAGDIYYGDSTQGAVVEVPVSGTTAEIASGFTTPVGVALDPNGNLYVADNASSSGISFYNRNAATLPAIPMERSGDAALTNIGNVSYSGGIALNTDSNASTDFTFAAGSSNGCNTLTSSTSSFSSSPLAAGNNCEWSITANTSTASDTVTFTGGSTLALSSQASEVVSTTTTLTVNNPSVSYGTAITGSVTVTPASGSLNPTGTVTLLGNGSTNLGSCTLANAAGNSSSCSFSLSNVNPNITSLTASYGGDSNDGTSISSGTTVNISPLSTTTTLTVTSSTSIIEGSAFTGTVTVSPLAAPGTVSLYLDGGSTAATTCTLSNGSCAWTLSGVAIGNHSLTATYGGSTDYATSTSSATSISVTSPPQAPAVATGDSRTVTEPSFPAVCAVLNAAITMVNNDIPASVDSTITNPDGARIQAALNGCAGTGQAVELSVDGGGDDAFLSGPLSMPSGVTLLVDPGVVLFFSRNVQDYDKVAGTHTCGTVNNNSATSSCLPLIDISGSSSNVGIMGFGKLDGRGGDPLINAFPASFAGQSWWGLSSIANGGGNQQNPRFIQMDSGSSNITLYKITIRNSPLFHVSTTGAVSDFTAWDIKIITPTSSRNTDGIDPGNATNFTITRSWISDGDDNVAVGGAGTTSPASNISVTNNRFFAGHGESIGSYTQAGISNVLFDSNMLSGNGTAGAGSAITATGAFGAGSVADSNSTGLRIKSGYDRGGVVTNIQYSNSCFQDHKAEIVFSPNYEATTGTASPNLENILMQNLTFLTEGTNQFTGTSNNGTIYPLGITLDNVGFPSTYPASEFSPAPTNVAMTYGPGQVSSDFVSDFATFVGSNGNTVSNNITNPSLYPPQCSFTYIAPELTGPNGVAQSIVQGQNATAVVILTPAVGGAAYPTGAVTLTDTPGSNTTPAGPITVSLPGGTDTLFVPITGLAAGQHNFTATYSGDSNYTLATGQTVYSTTAPYTINVSTGSLGGTTTTLSGVPSTVSFGTSFTAVAAVSGSSPTGTVEFIVNGSVFATAVLNSGSASVAISLPFSTSAYSIYAVYSGDSVNDGSISATSSVIVTPALTTTALSANTTTGTLGHPIVLTATVTSSVGAPTGTVTFTYTTTGSGTPQPITATLLASSTPDTSVATAGVSLPIGTDTVTATYNAGGSFAGSASAPMTFTITQGTILALPSNPIALPYTMTTLAGGASANCSAATDSFGDGCPATSIVFGGSVDLRSVAADPFGNVYLTDAVASTVRRIAPNGVITNFAGKVSGSACAPTATVGCTPTQVSIDKPRGVSSDTQGNIYIAGYDSHEVFKVSASTGLLYLVAGTGSAGSSGDGGPAYLAQVNGPRGVWADTVGNVYIADSGNNKIRVVDVAGNIHTFAGTGSTTPSGDGGLATAAGIDNPQGVMADANLNVYIADSAKIRVVCVTCGTGSPLDTLLATLGITSPQNGYIYTIAGGGSSSGPYPILATSVSMSPQKLGIDTSGNMYISDGNGAVWFFDAHTAYIRPIAGKTSTNCPTATDKFGDGCPATQAIIGDGGNGIGAGVDALGNLYISDTLNARIRKVTTGLASPATAVASTATQPVELHFIAGDNLASTNGLATTSTEWSLGSPACTTNSDSTADCLVSSSFSPAVPGARTASLAVASAEGNSAFLGLTGTGLGSGATLDPATQISFGSGLAVAGLAADNAGNVYVSDSNSKQLFKFAPAAQSQGASATGTSLGTFQAPGAVAVDPRGYVYVADTSAGTVTAISPAGASSVLPFTFTTPAGLAVDALNNLYVSDSTTKLVYQINPITGVERTLPIGTLVTPSGLSIDPSGNLLVADPGAPAIERFNFQTYGVTAVSTPAVAPLAALTDAAGNLLIADSADILAVPASSNSASFTVASVTPAALAIDSAGDLYTGSAGGVLKLARTQGYVQFSASEGPQTVNMLESGNQVFTGTSFTQADTTDYSLTPATSTDCTLNTGGAGTLAIGGVCSLSAAYTPTTFVATTDTVTFNGNLTNASLSTSSSVQLTLTGPSTPPASTITLGAFSPASPVYGQPVTLSATVAGSSITPTGTVVFTVDSTPYNATLTSGATSALVTGLTAGSHTVSAAYTSTNGYASATSSAATLVVAQATPVITWAAPAAITYGAPLSATQLDASANVAGAFAYSPAAGTILTAGTQTLSVTFTPMDTTDYTTATQTVQITVNQATPTITWPAPAAITYGTALSGTQLDATSGGVAGAFVYTPAAGTVLTAGTQTLSVTFTPMDTTDYTTATQTVQITVNQATPTITWPAPAAIVYGTALSGTQLNGTSGGVAGAFVYTPAAGTVLTAGMHTLSVTFTPTDTTDYTTATQTVRITVNQATPTIIWPAPAAIIYGTALSAAQLDASANVAGTLAYSPAAGTILGAGTQTLSVTFTPTDSTDYTTATQSVQLIVNKASSAVALSANPNPAAQGMPDVLTATVTGAGQPGGTVVFLSGTTTLCTSTLNASGVATCTFTPSASGALAISAQYQNDANHLASSASLTLNVYDTSISLQFASTQLTYPGATNVTVCVSGATKATPTGTIQIVDGTTTLTTLTLGGGGCAYWYISPGLNAGTHTITAVYSGDKNNPPGTSDPTVLTVNPVPVNMSASCWNSSFPYGGNYQCTVNVSSNAGAAQGKITYSYDGGVPVAVSLSGGNAQFTITEPVVGNQSVVIGYAQQTNYAAATPQTENFTVTPAPVNVALTPSTYYATVGTSITISVSVTSWSAGPPSSNGAVSFYDGSTLLAMVPVNSSGQASYTTSSLPVGSQTITATYAGGTNYASGSASANITIAQ